MAISRSDALVLSGVTEDLARKMNFPAFYVMAKRSALKVPVIGFASRNQPGAGGRAEAPGEAVEEI